jgi:hypothetical protein
MDNIFFHPNLSNSRAFSTFLERLNANWESHIIRWGAAPRPVRREAAWFLALSRNGNIFTFRMPAEKYNFIPIAPLARKKPIN